MKKYSFPEQPHRCDSLRRFIVHTIRCLHHAQNGAAAIEYAILAPVLMLLTFGILEMTLLFSSYLRAGEALRFATRTAATSAAIADLSSLDQTPIICTGGNSVSCSGASVNNAGGFDNMVAAAQQVLPDIQADQLTVEYTSSGVGFSQTASGTAPVITVKLVGYQHTLLLRNLIPNLTTVDFPDFTTSRMTQF